MNDALTLATGLATALGGGLLIGLERERRKGRGGRREAAGIRSFALAALTGGLAQVLAQPALVALGAAVVGGLVAVAYFASRRSPALGQPPADPGLTTELALFITYLVGVLSVQQPALGAGVAVVVAVLLAGRERLHRLATQAMSEGELHDALLLAALGLVLLPLVPGDPVPWLGGLVPRTVLLVVVVVLILALQGAGHVAGRVWGARNGLALSGLFSGFVSSTATIASMGVRGRAEPARRASCEAGALLSTVATWLQAVLLLAVTAPAAAWALLPSAAAGAAVAAAAGMARLRRTPAAGGTAPVAAALGPGAQGQGAGASPGPLRLREAVMVAALLAGVTLAVGWAERRFGGAGLLVGTALGALVDAHAPIAALGTWHAAGAIDTLTVRNAALVAVAANSCTRSVTAFVAGGRSYGLRVTGVLMAASAAALSVALVLR